MYRPFKNSVVEFVDFPFLFESFSFFQKRRHPNYAHPKPKPLSIRNLAPTCPKLQSRRPEHQNPKPWQSLTRNRVNPRNQPHKLKRSNPESLAALAKSELMAHVNAASETKTLCLDS